MGDRPAAAVPVVRVPFSSEQPFSFNCPMCAAQVAFREEYNWELELREPCRHVLFQYTWESVSNAWQFEGCRGDVARMLEPASSWLAKLEPGSGSAKDLRELPHRLASLLTCATAVVLWGAERRWGEGAEDFDELLSVGVDLGTPRDRWPSQKALEACVVFRDAAERGFGEEPSAP